MRASLKTKAAVFFGILAFAYLATSFINLSVNPYDWTQSARGMTVLFGTLFASFIAVAL